MAADRSANFVIKAKDAATGPLGKVGGAMGKLKSIAGTAFKAIAGAAIAAATAVAAFTAAAIKGAIEDERSTILTTAALKARGFELDKLAPKIEEQIKAAQRFGIADDRVRAGLEVGSRFFKSQTKLLKANELAMTISAVTGQDLESVVSAIGKATNGSTRGLAAMIGPIEKGATLSDLYAQGMGKFQGVAEELANSTSGKFAAAQETFNEKMDVFGAQFLPLVSEAMTFLVEKVFPAFQKVLDDVGPIISDIVDNYIRPLFDSVGELFAVLDNADFSVFDAALWLIKGTLDAVRIVIDLIVAGIKFIQGNPVDKAAFKAATEVAGNSSVYGMGGSTGGGGYGAGTTGAYTSSYATVSQAQFTIGKKAQSEFSYVVGENLANQTRATSAARTFPRGGK
jgi:hypothetical protein